MKQRETFQTPYSQYKEYRGKEFEILAAIPPKHQDESSVYEIKFKNGHTIEALPEEIFSGIGWEPIN